MALKRDDVALVLGIAGLLLGGAACYLAFDASAQREDFQGQLDEDRERIEQLVNDRTQLMLDVSEANKRISSLREELRITASEVDALRRRLDAGPTELPATPDDGK